MNFSSRELWENLLNIKRKMAENIKNPKFFDISYVPDEIYIRKEMEEVAGYLAEYFLMGTPKNIIVYGHQGSGKTTSILNLLETMRRSENGKMDYAYINAGKNATTSTLLRNLLGDFTTGYGTEDMFKKFLKHYQKLKINGVKRYVVVIDEADSLKDSEIYKFISRQTDINMVILTRNMQWVSDLEGDIKSSLLPIYVHFPTYEIAEIKTILEMRAKEGLYKYNEGFLNLLSARLYREHNSDIRIGIRSLLIVAQNNSLEFKDKEDAGSILKIKEEIMERILKEAAEDVESSTIKEMKDKELIILRSLIEDPDTNKAFRYTVSYMSVIYGGYSVSKKQFFNILHAIEVRGLFTTIRKQVGRTYTLEVVGLSQYENLIKNEFDRRFRTHSEVVVN